jgi:hypothetical protein
MDPIKQIKIFKITKSSNEKCVKKLISLYHKRFGRTDDDIYACYVKFVNIYAQHNNLFKLTKNEIYMVFAVCAWNSMRFMNNITSSMNWIDHFVYRKNFTGDYIDLFNTSHYIVKIMMLEWCESVVRKFNYHDVVLHIFLYLFEQIFTNNTTVLNKNSYELAVVTMLWIGIKYDTPYVVTTHNISPLEFFINMCCNNNIIKEDVLILEIKILRAIGWCIPSSLYLKI